jgi:serine/threonine protein kinase
MSSGVEPQTVDSFLKTVLRSGLIDREQLQSTLNSVPRDLRTNPEALADHLVRHNKLTRFQAAKLLQGTALGLKLGPFHVQAPIGKGGMGTVYLAMDTRSGQTLALKVLSPKRAREEERVLARFRREMEMCQKVAHPHLAWTYEVGVCQGVYYIAMEYIPGKSLYRLVGEEGPLRVQQAAQLFSEVASALDHAHCQGLIHRDMKPSNIIVTPNHHAKVLDLGLALVQGETSTAREVVGGQGYVVGSMDYIAPEQAEDATNVDPRSDIYGLGCTLFYALTGRPPFPGGTTLDKLQRHCTEEPVPVHQLNPAVPPAFAALLSRMMAKRPEYRFPSAAVLRQELIPWSLGEHVLPLDEKGDQGYQQAVAALAVEEVPAELIAEAIPVEDAGPPPRKERTSSLVIPRPRRPQSLATVHPMVWVGLGIFWGILLLVMLVVLLLQ